MEIVLAVLTVAALSAVVGELIDILPGDDDPRRVAVREWISRHSSPSAEELAVAGYVAPHWPRPYGLGADKAEDLETFEELHLKKLLAKYFNKTRKSSRFTETCHCFF